MLSEATASRVFARPSRLPDPPLEGDGSYRSLYGFANDEASYSEADDIAAYLVDSPGISYTEALVTLASDASMSKQIGLNLLVPLRVLRVLSSLHIAELKAYVLTFEYDHLVDVFRFTRNCTIPVNKLFPLFPSDEQIPWNAMSATCAFLTGYIREIDFKVASSEEAVLLTPLSSSFHHLCASPNRFSPRRSRVTSDHNIAPQSFDVVRTQEVKYRRGFELMHATVRDSKVYLKSQPLTKATIELLTKYSIKLGPLGEVGMGRAANGDSGGEHGMPGLNEVIEDVNNGIRAPARWLLSHVLCGRISGSDEEGSKTSWFPQRSSEGQYVHVPLSLHRITDNVGPLFRSSQGSIVLPMLGCGKLGTLSVLPMKSGQNSQAQTEWRSHLPDESFEQATDHGWEVARTELC